MNAIKKKVTLPYRFIVENGHIHWLLVIMGSLIMMCLGTVYSWSVIRLPVEENYRVGVMASGIPYMTSLVFYALSMLLAGRHLDDICPRTMIWTGGALVAAGWILSSFAGGIVMLTLTYGVITGVGVGFAYGAAMTVAARLFPRRRGLSVGLVLLGFGMSPLVTAPLLSYLIAAVGLSNTFLILGLIFGIMIPLLAIPLRLPPLEETEEQSSVENKKSLEIPTAEMVRTPSFRRLYGTFLIATTIGLTMIGITGRLGVTHIGITPATSASFVALFALLNGLGRPLFGWLTDRIQPFRAIYLSFSLLILASILMLFAGEGDLFLFALAFSLFWLNLGGWLAIAPTTILSFYGIRNYGRNYGVLFTAYGAGAVAGVLLSGVLLELLNGTSPVFGTVIALCLGGLILARKIQAENSRELSRK